eukprot:PhM_4_TR11117/c0_g1_i1/m.49755
MSDDKLKEEQEKARLIAEAQAAASARESADLANKEAQETLLRKKLEAKKARMRDRTRSKEDDQQMQQESATSAEHKKEMAEKLAAAAATATPDAPPTVTFSNGDTYRGDVLPDGTIEGKGLMTYHASGNTYDGDWKGGARHGKGTFTFKVSGTTYTGDWVNNQRHGQGTLKEKDGTYVGGFIDNSMKGYGE